MSESLRRRTGLAGYVGILVGLVACPGSGGGCGGGGGGSSTNHLDGGNVENTSVDCSSFVSSSALNLVCQTVNDLGGACSVTPPSCVDEKEELFAGSSLRLTSDNRNTSWNKMGGAGHALSDASVCLLSDLSKGSKANPANAVLFGQNFSITQTIGFVSFDPGAKTFEGYQRDHICVPVAGCFDARIQGITAHVNLNDPADGGGLPIHAGAFPIAQAYGLVLTQEQSDESFSASAPAITIATPYGDVSATPGMSYSSHMGTTLFPSGDVLVDVGIPGIPQLANVLGTIGGVVQETDLVIPDTGWVSQAGIGSRQASHPHDPIWPGGTSTARPDIQGMTTARASGELMPVADYVADVNVQYAPPIPSFLTAFPLQTQFDIFVQPQAEVRYSSQLEAEFDQAWLDVADAVTNPKGSITFKSRAEALASFSLSAGVDLTVAVNLPPFDTSTIIDLHPRVSVPLTDSGGPSGTEQVIGAASVFPDPHNASGAANTIYDAPLATVTTPNSGSPDPSQFITQCLSQAPASQPAPQPTATPGEGSIFQDNLYYPCNICVGYLGFSYPNCTPPSCQCNPPACTGLVILNGQIGVPAQAQLFQPSTNGGPTDWTCDPYHVGCFDLCSFSPGSVGRAAFLGVVKTAGQLNETSATVPGWACNRPYQPPQ
jgi:hypothetical protein